MKMHYEGGCGRGEGVNLVPKTEFVERMNRPLFQSYLCLSCYRPIVRANTIAYMARRAQERTDGGKP
jgi:hypothetical protein